MSQGSTGQRSDCAAENALSGRPVLLSACQIEYSAGTCESRQAEGLEWETVRTVKLQIQCGPISTAVMEHRSRRQGRLFPRRRQPGKARSDRAARLGTRPLRHCLGRVSASRVTEKSIEKRFPPNRQTRACSAPGGMALPSSPPSSPPSLPQEQDSPPLFAVDPRAPISQAGTKRQLQSDYGNVSSDPLFSDDGSEPELWSEIHPHRRKRLVRGPWWTVGRSTGSNRGLWRDLLRKDGRSCKVDADSGVWMGSDDDVDPSVAYDMSINTGAVREFQSLASAIILACLEDGKEVVDLSDLGLSDISDDTLKPLRALVRITEDQYRPLTTSIQLYLSGNKLTSLPAELFNLMDVTVLSLRNNDLSELPSSIARLHNLKELNVAGNSLRHLPWELLSMLHSPPTPKLITVRPNPLYTLSIDANDLDPMSLDPSGGTDPLEKRIAFGIDRHNVDASQGCDAFSPAAELKRRLNRARAAFIAGEQAASRLGSWAGRMVSVFLASSRISYFDIDGTCMNAAKPRLDTRAPVLEEVHTAPSNGASAAAPSLFELAVRRLQKARLLKEALAMLPEDAPLSIPAVLKKAAVGAYSGNQTCSTCGKETIIHRAEWLEYWCHEKPDVDLREDNILPLLRRTCSWACAEPTAVGAFVA